MQPTSPLLDHSTAPDLPAGGSGYLALQRAGLRAVQALSAPVLGPAEAAIAREFEHARGASEKRHTELTAVLQERLAGELAAAEQACAARVRAVEAEFAAAEQALSQATAAGQQDAALRVQETEREARREREDELLMVETVTDATVRGLREQFQAVQRDIAHGRAQLEAVHTRAAHVLAAHGCAPGEPPPPVAPETAGDPAGLHRRYLQAGGQHLVRLERLAMPELLVGPAPALGLLLLNAAAVAAAVVLHALNVPGLPPVTFTAPVALGCTLLLTLLVGRMLRRSARALLLRQVREGEARLQAALALSSQALDEWQTRATEQLRDDEARTLARRERKVQAARHVYAAAVGQAERQRDEALQRLAQNQARDQAEHGRRRERALNAAAEDRGRQEQQARQHHAQRSATAQAEYERELGAARDRQAAKRAALEQHWQAALADLARLLEATDRLNRLPRMDWNGSLPPWTPPHDFTAAIPFGTWRLDLTQLAPSVRQRAAFLDGRAVLTMPALLELPARCALFLESERAGRAEAIEALRAVMLRLLVSLPPGRVRFTIIDPVGLVENFAGFMHLVDYEEALIGGRIWTESDQIEARLTELTSHMENVIQKYLRNEFDSIDAYNRQAGELAEPYRFLVIADFPANFSEEAIRRLTSIVASGARCGVFTLIAHDRRLPAPAELRREDVIGGAIHLVHEDGHFALADEWLRPVPLELDRPPAEDVLTGLMHAVGRAAKDALRVEVPFDSIVPPAAELWSGSARQEVRVPLGHTGAVRQQHLKLGRGLAQHALIAGKTGSGKSNLLHVMITNLGLWYSPEEVEFYLVDFKKGVEFKAYATHGIPHARAIAIESDREFGVSVLQRIDAELARRGDLFRAAGVQDLPGYRATGAALPRVLLIVDEFQVFFTEDDKLAQEAAVLLDRLVRQGRAFGIHVLLGSQTLGGSSGLARSTMGQMAIRIALQCSEADSQLILDDANVAARLLSRPGEAIYNDAGGIVEGNSPFQIAWLPDERRNTYLARISALARARAVQGEPAIVFEGNAPADIRHNRVLAARLAGADWTDGAGPQVWLGDPVAIKPPTAVTLARQSGANLLLVGQRADAAAADLAAALVALGVQRPPAGARFFILDGGPSEAPHADVLRAAAATLPHAVRIVAWHEVAAVIAELAAELQRRLQAVDQPGAGGREALYLFIYGLQRYRLLRRQEDSFRFGGDEAAPAPDRQFAELLREGPPLGLHTLAWCDTLANLERTLERAALGEFDHRVLFQMSAADSSNLIDSPEANRLGFYRALLYSEEHGRIEKFRPYAPAAADWLAQVQSTLTGWAAARPG